jgi:hypothetical protein
MSASARTQWNIEADYLQACSCDYGCPCEFSAPPTRGYCEGMGAWKITQGRYGDVSLDGLGVAFAARWPGALHEGGGTACLFFDERATPAQREALLQICSGQAGGLPFEIIVTTFAKILEPQYVPIDFHVNGRHSRVRVGQAMNVALEPIRNPVTKEPESVRVEHPTGFIFKSAECVAAAQMEVKVGELTFSWPDKAAFVTRIHYSN